MPETWTFDDMSDQTGRVAVVTGASSGLGRVAAQQLAAHGATVLMAVRDVAKGERVRAELSRAELPGSLEVHHLDLADLDSVRRFADALHRAGRPIDLLLNNAGIYPTRHELSPQGHESTFATNHLGHFALTGLLLDLFRPEGGPRVVSVGSELYRSVRAGLEADDVAAPRSFSAGPAYARSKLANTLFAGELDRRLRASGSPVRSFLAHPGLASTPMNATSESRGRRAFLAFAKAVAGRTPEQGTVPLLFAATSPRAATGVLLGPSVRKWDNRVHFSPVAPVGADPVAAARLWTVSQELTGVTYLDPAEQVNRL